MGQHHFGDWQITSAGVGRPRDLGNRPRKGTREAEILRGVRSKHKTSQEAESLLHSECRDSPNVEGKLSKLAVLEARICPSEPASRLEGKPSPFHRHARTVQAPGTGSPLEPTKALYPALYPYPVQSIYSEGQVWQQQGQRGLVWGAGYWRTGRARGGRAHAGSVVSLPHIVTTERRGI